MQTCPSCSSAVADDAVRCAACDRELAGPNAVDETRIGPPGAGGEETRLSGHDDATRLSDGSGTKRSASSRPSSSGTGWLSSSGAIDHGRFPPGTLLGGRYRIVERLGRGGMGEVYRADDLKLGQPVALKFLAPDVDRDPARLTQLHTEVRMARQVSHPNVCRVYDIDEVDGHTFLSMEYVDGEDLSSLLRRIGRFPEDRALEIARQVCAGLAAAHERGVVHRDLKPANVMVDGGGKVRVTDFGLAGVSGESIRAGTPTYMAPEQLGGAEVTARSDIYALGLVLYEVFTGQRALDGRNIAELIRKREQSGIVPPTALIKDLDPRIEQAIMQCLRPKADDRPASALAVAAALPGGDPLAAALAAGETPSPEMVAAAGTTERISARHAAVGALWIVVALVTLTAFYQRVLLVNRVPLPKPPDALADRAQEAVARLGYVEPPRALASGMGISTDYLNYIDITTNTGDRWKRLGSTRPESVLFWYRTSPRLLVPWGTENSIAATNPPLNVSGMTLAVLDASGRLSEFHAVPEPNDSGGSHGPTDWDAVFAAAGLDRASFMPVPAKWNPIVFADERAAWEGHVPQQPELPLRVDAAAYHGRVVFFVTNGPWTRSARSAPPTPSMFSKTIEFVAALVMPGLMAAGALLARRNLRMERGDRVGAFRAASAVFFMTLGAWLLGATHVPDLATETERVFGAIGMSLFNAGLLWLTYLGLEPYVRRTSPDSLIGWTRLVAGRWHDPKVASDVITGVSAGLLMTLVFTLYYLLPPLAGRPEPMPALTELKPLLGVRQTLAGLLAQATSAVTSGMLGTVGLAGFLILLKRPLVAMAAAIACFTPVVVSGMFSPGYPMLSLALGAVIITVLLVVILRTGLLASIAALATHFILLRAPLTTDFGAWRAPTGAWHVGAIALLGLGACYVARSDRAQAPPLRSLAPAAGR